MAKHVYYGICTTAAGTTPKVVLLQGEQSIPTIVKGDLLTVHFTNGNTVAAPTITLTLPSISTNTSNNTGMSIKMRGAEPISGAVNEWDCVNAWEAGENKQFVAELLNDNGDANSTQVSYWGMLDGGNATDELYGDVILFDESNPAWLDEEPGDLEHVGAVTPATIRALLGGDDGVSLEWTQQPPSSGTYIKLGDMYLSSKPDDKKEIYLEKTDISTWFASEVPDKTSDLTNDGENPNDSYVFIENYDDANIQFVGGYFKVGAPASGGTAAITTPTELYGDLAVYGTSNLDITNAGVTTVESLTSGPINGTTITASSTINGNSTISAASDIYEKTQKLSDKYSGVLEVIRYRVPSSGNFELDAGKHNHAVPKDANNNPTYSIARDGRTPIGIIGWNINEVNNEGNTQFIYPWEMYLTSGNKLCLGFRNTKTDKKVKFYVYVDILYVVNTGHTVYKKYS